jgi:hypothetical protein
VQTNAVIGTLGGGFSSPADGSTPDQVCGWGGDDRLFGDRDDQAASGVEDWLDGGAGFDTCDGDNLIDGSDTSDAAQACETRLDARATSSLFSCAASDDPIHEW